MRREPGPRLTYLAPILQFIQCGWNIPDPHMMAYIAPEDKESL